MKKLASFLLFSQIAFAQTMFQSFNKPTGLVGWWKLTEGSGSSALDSSGYGNTGTWFGSSGGTSGHYSPGNVGPWAGFFDGSTNSITVPYNIAFDFNGPVTLTAWVYPTNSTAYHGILSKGTNTREYAYFLDQNGTSYIYASLGDYPNGNLPAQTAVSPGWTVNAWNFIVMTADGTSYKLYINGVLAANNASTLSSVTANNGIGIGSDSNGTQFLMQGRLSDLRVYKRVLTAGEIAQMALAHN